MCKIYVIYVDAHFFTSPMCKGAVTKWLRVLTQTQIYITIKKLILTNSLKYVIIYFMGRQ